MCKADPQMLKTLAGRVDGAGSLLAAMGMGITPLTAETINTIISTLRDAADRLEELESAARPEGS